MSDVKYYVQVLGGPPCEKILLESSVVIGSDVADGGLKLDHPHLSGEHCTVSLQSGVLSIIDHNSDLGVEINGKKIPPNKMIIVLPADEVKLGHLTLKIHAYEESAITEEQKTKILSLDDLSGELGKEEFKPLSDSAIHRFGEEAPATNLKNLEVEAPEKIEKDDEPWKKLEVAKKVEKVAEDLSRAEKELDLTKTTTNKSQLNPLEKFKRSAKLHEGAVSNGTSNVKKSKQNFKQHKNLTHKYYFAQFDSVSFPIRFFAVVLDLILGIRLSLWLLEKDALEFFDVFNEFIKFSFDFVTNLHPTSAAWTDSLISLSPYLIGYLILRVLGTCVLGVSVGQFLIGCWFDGNFYLKRILGLVREVLGFILAPLMIFDLPALFSKKTVKEMLTMTGLECYSKTLSYVLGLTLIPLSIALCFFTPFFLNEAEKTVDFFPQSIRLNAPSELSSAPVQSSTYMSMQSPWQKSSFISYPSFKLIKSDEGNDYVMKMTLIDPADQLILRMEKGSVFPWQPQLQNLMKMYPMLWTRYPALYQFSQGSSSKIKAQDFMVELKQVLDDSLQINLESLPQFFLSYGPYVEPFLQFRRAFLKSFPVPVKSIEFWKTAGMDYIFVETSRDATPGKWQEFFLLPLSLEKSNIYRVMYMKDKLAKSKVMLKHFLSVTKYDVKIPNQMSMWSGSELNSAEVLDFYSIRNTTAQQKEKMAIFLYNYYFMLAKSALSSPFDLYYKDYGNVLQQTILMLADFNSEDRKILNPTNNPMMDVGFDHLIKKLSELKENLKLKQATFFQVPKYP